MAASLAPAAFGVVSDPFAGLRDLDDGVVRVLHGLSYVDDPTRVLRAVRFESRYGFRMDEGTERLARQAISACMLAEVSGARLREELIDILGERESADVLARLADLGALPTLLPQGARVESVVRGVEDVQRAFEAIAGRISGTAPTITTALFCSLCAGVPERSVLMWVRHLHANKSFAEKAQQLAERGPAVLRVLEQPKAVRDSRLYRALEPLHAEILVVLWALAGAQGRTRMERYFDELAGVRSAVSGADLIAMGATPSDAFSAILARALDDRLDGRAVGRKAELANLRRLALRAGVLTIRKDRV
jgi:tRNA nucleotidyltransferase (CCA-adding enzyme)